MAKLSTLESTIHKGLQGPLRLGKAFLRLQESRAFTEKGYSNFRSYLRAEWPQFSISAVSRYIRWYKLSKRYKGTLPYLGGTALEELDRLPSTLATKLLRRAVKSGHGTVPLEWVRAAKRELDQSRPPTIERSRLVMAQGRAILDNCLGSGVFNDAQRKLAEKTREQAHQYVEKITSL